jgi:group I intron endonuclease
VKTTFIYCLNDPLDLRLRYVGKADDPYKRWRDHLLTGRTNDHRGHWISKLMARGLRPELEVLEEVPMAEWQKIEKEYIRVFRMVGMNLVNDTEGGDGVMGGRSFSEMHRERLRAARKGKRSPMLGKKHSLATRQKIGKAHKGKAHSKAWRENIRISKLNQSEETKSKISDSLAAYHRRKHRRQLQLPFQP